MSDSIPHPCMCGADDCEECRPSYPMEAIPEEDEPDPDIAWDERHEKEEDHYE